MGGMDELIEAEGGLVEEHHYRAYPKHDYEDKLWRWFNELEERFPCEVECDFIEVSPRMTKYNAKAYWRTDPQSQFIRVAKFYIDEEPDENIRETILHEMVHLYTYQEGFANSVNDASRIFTWICGQVGVKINQVPTRSAEWRHLAEPFIED